MSDHVIPMPSDVRARYRPWVIGCLSAIAGVIGWEATIKAVDVGVKYYRDNPMPAKESPAVVVTNDAPTVDIQASSFSIRIDGRYARWSGADRSGWPRKTVGGKDCNGLLYAAVIGKPPRKVEWIPVGREYTGLKNALNPAEPSYYQPDMVPGARVRLEIRDVGGKLRNPAYVGEDTFKGS